MSNSAFLLIVMDMLLIRFGWILFMMLSNTGVFSFSCTGAGQGSPGLVQAEALKTFEKHWENVVFL